MPPIPVFPHIDAQAICGLHNTAHKKFPSDEEQLLNLINQYARTRLRLDDDSELSVDQAKEFIAMYDGDYGNLDGVLDFCETEKLLSDYHDWWTAQPEYPSGPVDDNTLLYIDSQSYWLREKFSQAHDTGVMPCSGEPYTPGQN